MKKILFVATVPEHFHAFHVPCFEMLKSDGWEVHTACAGETELPGCDKQFVIPIERNPFAPSNREAYRQLKKIIDENKYDVIHCHTPVGGMIARLAARKARRGGTKVFYTAHGFHFYKGAPLLNWLIYFPVERFLSRMTDELITINCEDFERAKRLMKAKKIELVHGVGYNDVTFSCHDKSVKSEIRKKYGYSDDEKLLVYVAELNKNKNQGFLIETLQRIEKENPSVRLLLAGPDHIDGEYKKLAELVNVKVDFLGMRDDVPELLKMCDVYVASSLREGLPVNVMEAMASGLPVVAVDNRGHRALVSDGETGFVVKPGDIDAMSKCVDRLLGDGKLRESFSKKAAEKIRPFGKENVICELHEIYSKYE